MKYPHLILNNPLGTSNKISKIRGWSDEKKEEEENLEKDYSFQKNQLMNNLSTFKSEREFREIQRTIELPYILEYIEINFFVQFNKDIPSNDYYIKTFGLTPVSQRAFNKTVLFYINDKKLFSKFINLIEQFYNSADDVMPSDHEWSIVTIIHSFEFLSSNKIKRIISDNKIIVSLTDGLKGNFYWNEIENELLSYLEEKNIDFSLITNGLIELTNANDYIDEIVNNFDVIQKIQSIPPVHVGPSAFGTTKFGWHFKTVPNDNLPVVGIIDTGIAEIDPLQPLIVGDISILDRPSGIGDSHGTSVASLVAFGRDLRNGESHKYSSANLFSIQVLYREEGTFSLIKLKNAIIEAHKEYNIRIFNLSICNPYSFEYNADYSEYAKMLDELAYIYDLLIFIAAGNLSEDYREYVKCELSEDTSLVNYPNHFYNEHNQCYSQPTNIGSPSESMNNITVGAIASNIYDNRTDLTISHELPSYFSRKYHIDYSQKINDSDFNDNQKNKNIFKPDILMPGGDWLIDGSKMEVLGRGILMNDYYVKLSGTSLATPLAANLAAKIIGRYPDINMQSVKALLINSAETTNIENILSDNIEKIKEKESINNHDCSFSKLSEIERRKISKKYNCKRLAKCIEGHGVPDEDKCLNSSNKRVTFIIEDNIKSNHFQVRHIKLPEYLLESDKHKVLSVTGTICFKFSPVKDNSIEYNSLHISFNIFNAQSSSEETARILSNEKDDEGKPLIVTQERNDKLKIKSDSHWSEDFGFVNRKIFSNTQKLKRIINKKDLQKVENEIAVAVRCLTKKTVAENIEHPYSMVITIEEYDNIGLEDNLYEEISAINVVQAVANLDTALEIEIAN